MAAIPVLRPAPRWAAQVGRKGLALKSMNISISATTREKMAGVWQTADPMSMLVVRRWAAAGWREIPRQAWAAG